MRTKTPYTILRFTTTDIVEYDTRHHHIIQSTTRKYTTIIMHEYIMMEVRQISYTILRFTTIEQTEFAPIRIHISTKVRSTTIVVMLSTKQQEIPTIMEYCPYLPIAWEIYLDEQLVYEVATIIHEYSGIQEHSTEAQK